MVIIVGCSAESKTQDVPPSDAGVACASPLEDNSEGVQQYHYSGEL